MSATEEKTRDRSDSSEQQDQDSAQQHEGRADDGKRREDADEEQRETKAEEKNDDDEKKDEKSSKPGLWKKLAGSLPLIFGVGFCVAFFVWVCLQMAGQTIGGPPLLVGIFGGSVLGILAAGAGMGFGRLTSDDD